MASGILGNKTITSSSSGTGLVVYTVPASTLAVLNINIASLSSSAQTVDVALPDETDGTFDNNDLIENDTSISAKGVLERTGVVLEAGRSVVVTSSDGTGVAVNVYGIEESV